MHLFQTLPNYVPKTTIEFTGKLQQKVVRSLELSNPSKSDVAYRVRVDGSEEFSVGEQFVVLPAKGTLAFPIEFVGKFTKPSRARLTFLPKREGLSCGTVMVFDLHSSGVSLQASRTIDVSSSVYSVTQHTVSVRNPFDRAGKFAVTLVQQPQSLGSASAGSPQAPAAAAARAGAGARAAQSGAASSAAASLAAADVTLEAFSTSSTVVKLQPNESVDIVLDYTPVVMGVHTAQIVFSDVAVGEFAYNIVGRAELPAPSDVYKVTCASGQTAAKELALPLRNIQLEKALVAMAERRTPGKKAPARAREAIAKLLEFAENVVYQAEYSSPFYAGPPRVVVDFVAAASKVRASGARVHARGAL